MAGIPKEHEKLYFDVLCRTKKLETVLSLIQATYHAKSSGVDDVKAEIAKRLENAYNLFKDNIRGQDSGSGTYSGTMKQFESQYTIGHELCIWSNSDLDLTPKALAVAENKMTIREYFDIFFLSYFQPVDNKAIHVLYFIIKYMIDHNTKELDKNDIPLALGVGAEKEDINALCNFLDGTSYIRYEDKKLIYVGEEDIKSFINRCNTKYIGIDGLAKARVDLSEEEKYIEYIMSGVPYSKTTAVIEESDPKELIVKTYQSHDYDFEEVKAKYDQFGSLFGKAALESLSDEDTLKRLFAPKEGLTYCLEFNPDYSYFGGIGGGNAFKYPLFYSSDGNWKTGTVKNPVTLTEEQAVTLACEVKNKLLFLLNSIEEIGTFDSVSKYAELYELLENDPMYRRLWVMKYVHMIFYDKFSAYFDVKWTNRLLQCIGETPIGGIYSQSGQLSIIANELSIPNIFMEKVLNELFPPKNETIEEEEEENAMLPVLEKRTNKTYPLNMILYGAPGTGKTYATAQIALAILEKKSDSIDDIVSNKITVNREDLMKSYKSYVENGQIVFTTFHQSYGYEDFIQGLRPDDSSEKLSFKPVDGVFKRIAEKALENPNNNFVIIIDEINRGNISKVLGELITLVEEDKRWGEVNALSITLPSGDVFVVPNNLYIVGTMNSADKSISLIDAALRRRFSFVEVSPDCELVSDSTLKEVLRTINKKLESELESTDLLVGHAYFIGKSKNDLADIMNRSIVPLLYEYFFDNKNKVLNILKEALKDTGFEVEDKTGRRLKVVKA